MTTKIDPQDVGLDIFLDEFDTCGEEHPVLEYNNCILTMDHKPEIHQDAAGNEWTGKSDA